MGRRHRRDRFSDRALLFELHRIRLTADGRLSLCLFSQVGHDIKSRLRGGASDERFGIHWQYLARPNRSLFRRNGSSAQSVELRPKSHKKIEMIFPRRIIGICQRLILGSSPRRAKSARSCGSSAPDNVTAVFVHASATIGEAFGEKWSEPELNRYIRGSAGLRLNHFLRFDSYRKITRAKTCEDNPLGVKARFRVFICLGLPSESDRRPSYAPI